MQFLCEDVDLAGQVGVGFGSNSWASKSWSALAPFKGRLAVLADHAERRQEDRLK